MSNTATTLKAFHVQEESEATCCIVFDTNSASARRHGACELNVEWETVEFCRRAHWADQYASTGRIPPMAMIEQGWRLECGHCGQEVSQDLFDNSYGDTLPIVVGDWIYCNAECHNSEIVQCQQKQEAKLAALQAAKDKFPGANVFGYYKTSDDREAVSVLAPGTKRPATWVIGESTVSTSECDKDAWTAYVASIKEASQ